MKRTTIKRIMAGFWALAVAVMSSMTALAADTVDVNGSGRYADSTSVAVGYSDKDLFSNMKNLMPGDTIENQITVSNKSSRSVTIYLKAYSGFTSEDGITAVRGTSTAQAEGKTFRDDLLDQIKMTLKLGDTILYEGSADGESPEAGYEAMTDGDYGISLGSFAAGQQSALTVQLTLPGPVFDNSFADRFDAVDWVFCVEGTTPSSGGGGGGTTGNRAVSTIEDSDVPLAPWTGETGDTNIVITEPGVPLATIPKLGDTGTSSYVFGILLALLAACSAAYIRKRCSRM